MQDFLNEPNAYICCWPGDDRVGAQWAGNFVLMPSRNEVARATHLSGEDAGKPIKGSPFRYNSAIGRDGAPIPGTVAIEDQLTIDPQLGNQVVAFDAGGFVRGLWQNNKGLKGRGFRVVRKVDDIPAAMAEGRVEWEQQRTASAEQTIADEITRRKRDEAAGVPPRPSSDDKSVKAAVDYLRTVQRQAQHEAISTDDLMASLQGGVPAKAVAAPAPRPAVPEISEAAFMAGALVRRAKELDVKLTKAELEGLLLEDVAVLDAVSRRLEEETAPVAKGA